MSTAAVKPTKVIHLVQAKEPAPPKPPLWRRLLHNLHIYVMADTEAPIKYWNTTMVTTWCAVVSLILVLLGIICTGAFTLGVMYNQMQNINDRLKIAEDDAAKAKMLEAAKQGQNGAR